MSETSCTGSGCAVPVAAGAAPLFQLETTKPRYLAIVPTPFHSETVNENLKQPLDVHCSENVQWSALRASGPSHLLQRKPRPFTSTPPRSAADSGATHPARSAASASPAYPLERPTREREDKKADGGEWMKRAPGGAAPGSGVGRAQLKDPLTHQLSRRIPQRNTRQKVTSDNICSVAFPSFAPFCRATVNRSSTRGR